MRKMKMMNFNITKLFAIFLSLFLVIGIQTTNVQADTITTIKMGTDITITLDGQKVDEDVYEDKVIRAVKSDDSSIFYTKGAGKTSFPIVDGTYDLYDLTGKEITKTVHEDLVSNATLKVENGKVTKKAEMGFFTEYINGKEIVYQKSEKKYAILVVAGQSNAVGYDESYDTTKATKELYTTNSRVKQLGLYGEDNLKIIELGATAQNFQDMRKFNTAGIQLPLGKELLNYIPEDYELVIIPAAYGGTGFTTSNQYGSYNKETKSPTTLGQYKWGVESAYYKTIVDRISYLLDMNDDNYYIGTVWCQGEHDGGNADLQKKEFVEMTDAFFKYFNEKYEGRVGKEGNKEWSKDQWFIYESVPYWTTEGKNPTAKGVEEIFENYRTWNPKTYVDIEFGDDSSIYTNETNGQKVGTAKSTSSNQPTHYGNGAFAKLVAPKVIEVMEKAGAITKISE